LIDGAFRAVGVIILRISHGYKPKSENDNLVRIADEATDQLNILLSPGLFAVDFLPFLRYIPEWFPGGGFHKIAREWRHTLVDLTDKSYEFVLDQMVRFPTLSVGLFWVLNPPCRLKERRSPTLLLIYLMAARYRPRKRKRSSGPHPVSTLVAPTL
jgi:hypothetical protein